MAIMPKEASWVIYAMLITLLTGFTVTVAFREHLASFVGLLWHKYKGGND